MARQPQTTKNRPTSRRVGALRGLAPFLRPYRLLGLGALAALMLTATVSLVLPLAVRRVVDGFQSANAALLDQYFAAALAIAALLALGTGAALLPGHPAGRAGGGRYPPGAVRPGDRHEPGLLRTHPDRRGAVAASPPTPR